MVGCQIHVKLRREEMVCLDPEMFGDVICRLAGTAEWNE